MFLTSLFRAYVYPLPFRFFALDLSCLSLKFEFV